MISFIVKAAIDLDQKPNRTPVMVEAIDITLKLIKPFENNFDTCVDIVFLLPTKRSDVDNPWVLLFIFSDIKIIIAAIRLKYGVEQNPSKNHDNETQMLIEMIKVTSEQNGFV